MLEAAMKAQLSTYLQMLRQPIRLIASLDGGASSAEMRELLVEIADLSDKVTFDESGSDARTPSFVIAREGETTGVRFAAIPLGHEFTSLVLALLWTGGHPPKVEPEVIEQIKGLDGEHRFEVYMSLSCHNCPDVVQAAALMAIFNPKIHTVVIDGALYQEEVERRQVMAVPMMYRNDEVFGSGRMLLEEIVGKLDVKSDEREAAKLSEKEPFDVLIVGGGPAGAAAAVYAARKGIRVGIAAERFGGHAGADTLARGVHRGGSAGRATTHDQHVERVFRAQLGGLALVGFHVELGDNFLQQHAARAKHLAIAVHQRHSQHLAALHLFLEQTAVDNHRLNVWIHDGHQTRRLNDVRAVVAREAHVHLEVVLAVQSLDLFDHLSINFGRVAAGPKQSQHQRGELVAKGNGRKSHTSGLAFTGNHKRRLALIRARLVKAHFVGQSHDLIQQLAHFNRFGAVVERSNQTDRLAQHRQVGGKLAGEGRVKHRELLQTSIKIGRTEPVPLVHGP